MDIYRISTEPIAQGREGQIGTYSPRRRCPRTRSMRQSENAQTSTSEQSDSDSSFYREAKSTSGLASRPRRGRGKGQLGHMPVYVIGKRDDVEKKLPE